jgi:NAD/NADP transhydrogenase beta subunit
MYIYISHICAQMYVYIYTYMQARNIMIVPGYGLAVSKGQYILAELIAQLRKEGRKVCMCACMYVCMLLAELIAGMYACNM